MSIEVIFLKISNLLVEWSGQLIFLGSSHDCRIAPLGKGMAFLAGCALRSRLEWLSQCTLYFEH
jgi:hypothetical protein